MSGADSNEIRYSHLCPSQTRTQKEEKQIHSQGESKCEVYANCPQERSMPFNNLTEKFLFNDLTTGYTQGHFTFRGWRDQVAQKRTGFSNNCYIELFVSGAELSPIPVHTLSHLRKLKFKSKVMCSNSQSHSPSAGIQIKIYRSPTSDLASQGTSGNVCRHLVDTT